jgi:hypothetical protein
MPDLEARLHALGAETQFPPTPDLVSAVRTRLTTTTTTDPPATVRPQRHRRRRTFALAIALALLVPAAALAAVPSTRRAILDWLGLRSVEVRVVPTTPTPGVSVPPGIGDLGSRTTLERARGRLPFTVRVPSEPTAAPQVYLAAAPPGGRVTFFFPSSADRPRLLVTEFLGSQTRTYLQKLLGPGAHAERVRVAGAPGVWLSGRPHGFIYADRTGAIRTEDTRLAGNVLLWERDGVVFRLEGRLAKAAALRVGASFH